MKNSVLSIKSISENKICETSPLHLRQKMVIRYFSKSVRCMLEQLDLTEEKILTSGSQWFEFIIGLYMW